MIKRSESFQLISSYLTRLLISVFLFSASAVVSAQSYYVSPEGSDTDTGSQSSPFRTLEKARDTVRTVNSDMGDDIHVYILGGNYSLDQTIEFDSRDSATNGHRIFYEAFGDEEPVFNGATQVTGWTEHSDNIYEATLDRSNKLRTLIINGERAYMASKAVGVTGSWGTYDVTAGQAPWARISGSHPDGATYDLSEIPSLDNPSDVEIMNQTTWNTNFVTVRGTEIDGDSRILEFSQPYAAIAFNQRWGGFSNSGTHTLSNAYEFLDEENEFYFDRSTNTLYYYTANTDMSSAEVWAPGTGVLVNVIGDSKSDRVENVTFKGLTFAYTEAVLPEVDGSAGKSTVQAATWKGAYSDEDWHNDKYTAYDVMLGAINVSHADSVNFEDGVIKHIGNEGINFTNDVVNSQIIGNAILDIGGSGVNIAHPQHVYIGDGGTYEKYASSDEGVVNNILVKNNLIYDATRLYWGHAAITAFFTDGLTIEHNQIQNTTYSGVSLGWGWNNFGPETTPDNPTTIARNNKFNNNRVYNVMTTLEDGGAFYTLGNQPDSEANGNYVKAPTTHFQGVYHPDEGSAYYTGTDLVFEIVPGQDNFELNEWRDKRDNHYSYIYTTSSSNATGAPNSTITNMFVFPTADWPTEALSIIENAGLESDYLDLLDGIPEPPDVPGLNSSAAGNIIEAEDGEMLGSGAVFVDSEASEGSAVQNINTGGSGIQFNNVSGATALLVRYASEQSGTFSAYIDDVHAGDIQFISTGAWSGSYADSEVLTINIPEGATLRLQRDDTDAIINIDYVVLVDQSFTKEAEDATLLGRARASDQHSGFSGSGFAEDLIDEGSAVEFNVNVASSGRYLANMVYAMGPDGPEGNHTMSVYVNGTDQVQTSLATTVEWNNWATQQEELTLIAGNNTIRYQKDADDTGFINIDYIELAPKIEIEDGVLGGGAVADNNFDGFSGFGFVSNLSEVGAYVETSVNVPTAGVYTLDMRYSANLPDSRSLSVYVNETDQVKANFESTGGWDSWATQAETVTLAAGENTIRLAYDADDNGSVNLDYITIK